MHKKMMVAALLGAAILLLSPVSVMARSDEDEEILINTDVTYIPTTSTESTGNEGSYNSNEIRPQNAGDGTLTPQGNLTLVDDVKDEEAKSLQYMTVQTRNGEYFYMIVDRNGSSENVYFLNMVDEKDLIPILSEEDRTLLEEETAPPVVEPEVEPEVDETSSGDEGDGKEGKEIPVGVLYIILGVAICALYYFLKIKKKDKGQDFDMVSDNFSDDAELLNEDEIERKQEEAEHKRADLSGFPVVKKEEPKDDSDDSKEDSKNSNEDESDTDNKDERILEAPEIAATSEDKKEPDKPSETNEPAPNALAEDLKQREEEVRESEAKKEKKGRKKKKKMKKQLKTY